MPCGACSTSANRRFESRKIPCGYALVTGDPSQTISALLGGTIVLV